MYHLAVARNGCSSRPPLSVTNLCRGPSVTNPCRGPLCRVLQSSVGLSQGGFVSTPPDAVTGLVAKRPPGPVTNPMFSGCCHIQKQGPYFKSHSNKVDVGPILATKELGSVRVYFDPLWGQPRLLWGVGVILAEFLGVVQLVWGTFSRATWLKLQCKGFVASFGGAT